MKIMRTFHPVGQGAFYSERHENFNIVYDCGTQYKPRPSKGIERTVKTAFGKDEEIDILFISHFDYDHVGHISTLRDSLQKIKKLFYLCYMMKLKDYCHLFIMGLVQLM